MPRESTATTATTITQPAKFAAALERRLSRAVMRGAWQPPGRSSRSRLVLSHMRGFLIIDGRLSSAKTFGIWPRNVTGLACGMRRTVLVRAIREDRGRSALASRAARIPGKRPRLERHAAGFDVSQCRWKGG